MKYFRPLKVRNLKSLISMPVLYLAIIIYICLYIITLGCFNIDRAINDTLDWLFD